MITLMPKPIKKYDCIGIVAASGPVDQQLLLDGLRNIHYMGFDSFTGKNIFKKTNYLAGSDFTRASDLNTALADSAIKAIMFARGGYGIMRILEDIDLTAIRRNPKIMVGMSDLTALSLSLFRRCGLVTFAGPMIATENGVNMDKSSMESLISSITNDLIGTELIKPGVGNVQTVRPGQTRGRLLGGCLSLVTALLGTDHIPDFSGAVIFLEEVNEPLYRIDRMLMQLKLNGIFERISGLVLGHFIGPNSEDQRPEVERLLLELTQHLSFPVISGFPHGHALPNLTLPHGAIVDMDAGKPSLFVTNDIY